MSGLATTSARWEGLLALSSGPSTTRSSSFGAMPPSHPQVLDASKAEIFANLEDVIRPKKQGLIIVALKRVAVIE